MKRVVVGLSGGVDSSVAAYLLKQQGYDVIGMFMKNWHDDSVTISNECPWMDDSHDAMIVAQQLGIPFQALDMSQEYKARIVDYMFAEYAAGRTPNPDVLCNREIKFDTFLKAAQKIGADFVATGHYADKAEIKSEGRDVFRLMAGADKNKDQSYFLCQVTQQQLSKSLFPLGRLQKSQVRQIAADNGLSTASKKDSQGLCFVGKVHLPVFLQQQLKPREGKILEVAASWQGYQSKSEATLKDLTNPFAYQPLDGKEVGTHNGAWYYTIGQRHGLGLGGMAQPAFVIATDAKQNIIYVGQGENHPGLYRKGLFIPADQVHWVREDLAMKADEQRTYRARIRYRQPLEECTLYCKQEGLYLVFKQLQRGITPGQFAAWYHDDELLGSGVISQ